MAKESMSDEEFKVLLTQKMREKGIPVYDMKDIIEGGMVYGSCITEGSFEERSLAGWLEAKKYRDEVRAASNRRVPLDELFF